MLRLFKSGTVTKATGTDQRSLQNLVERGLVHPTVVGIGKGEHKCHRWSAWDILAVCMVRDLRRRGFSIAQCGCILQKRTSYSPAEFRDAWKSDRRYLVVVGTYSSPLMSHAEVFSNNHLPLEEAFDLCLPLAVIDTEKAFQQVSEQLAAIQPESPEAQPCAP